MGPCPVVWMIGFQRLGRPHIATHPPLHQHESRHPGSGILFPVSESYLKRGQRITGKRGIHFGTVAALNVGQCPTFGPESPLLWESSTLTVTQGAQCPTAVPKWIARTGNMRSLIHSLS